MYGNNTFLGSDNSLSNSSGVINTRPLAADQLVIPDPAAAAAAAGIELGSTVGSHCTSSTASGCSSYGSPSSLVSGSCSFNMQRSISSHSFQKNGYHCHFASYPHDFLDMDTSPVRRVLALVICKAESPLLSESSLIIESMSKACKYSPEEKKERIERYRSKRNHRNFNKKIKYECRKILADSRPRIRGRFARNDEIEKILNSDGAT